jgi:hypothetical protein
MPAEMWGKWEWCCDKPSAWSQPYGKDDKSMKTQERLKESDLLIQLEDGLRVKQDVDGLLWVVQQREMKELNK